MTDETPDADRSPREREPIDEPGPAPARHAKRDAAIGVGVSLLVTLVLSITLLLSGMGPVSILVAAVAALFVTRPIATAIGAAMDERRGDR